MCVESTVESPPSKTDDEKDKGLLGPVKVADMAELQWADCELRAVIEYLEGQESAVPRVFSQDLSSFAIRQGVLFKNIFGTKNPGWLLTIPTSLRAEIFQDCHDDPTAVNLGYSRTLGRIREKCY